MRVLIFTTVVLAGIAVSSASAQQPAPSYWVTTAQGHDSAPVAYQYGDVVTTPVYSYPTYSYPQWNYSYPTYDSYPPWNHGSYDAPSYQTHSSGLRRDYEEKYDPAIPGGPAHGGVS